MSDGQVGIEQLQGAIVVALRGEHDMATADSLARAIEEVSAEEAPLVIDLSEADFIDSSVLNVILRLWRALDASERPLALVAVPRSTPAHVLELAGVAASLPVYATRDEALAALASGGPSAGSLPPDELDEQPRAG